MTQLNTENKGKLMKICHCWSRPSWVLASAAPTTYLSLQLNWHVDMAGRLFWHGPAPLNGFYHPKNTQTSDDRSIRDTMRRTETQVDIFTSHCGNKFVIIQGKSHNSIKIKLLFYL